MQNMINNLINGNLSDAREQAKRYTESAIYRFMMTKIGWSESKSFAASRYLKTGEGFQRYCDAD